MKRISLIGLMAIVAVCTANAQTKLDMGLDRLVKEHRAAQVRGTETSVAQTTRVLARLVPGQELPTQQLESMGAVVGERYGSFVSLSLPVGQLEELASMPQFSRIDQPKAVRSMADRTRRGTFVEPVQQSATALAEGLPHEYTGKGVMVGVVDNGIDYAHVNFYDPNTGTKRIKKAILYRNYTCDSDGRNMRDLAGHTTTPAQVREVYADPEQIDTLTTDCRHDSHGTMVASLAAGGYTGDYLSKDGQVIYTQMQGMAPESDLILAGLGGIPCPSDIVADAIYQTMQAGIASGQPFVMNLSVAEVYDWYDGKNPEDLMIDELTDGGTKPGVVVCRACGNFGDRVIYLHEDLDASNGHKLRFSIYPAPMYYNYNYKGSAECYLYCDDDTPFEVNLEFYERNGDDFTRVDSLAIPHDKLMKMGLLTANHYAAHDGRYAAHFVLPYNRSDIPDDLYPSLLVTSDKDCRVRVVADTNMENANAVWTVIGLNLEDEGTILIANNESSILGSSCTNSVISVGAWYVGSEYIDYDGNVHADDSAKGDIAVFSSYCVSDDNGISRPDVCAPGMFIVAGTNGYDLGYWPYHDGSGVLGVAANDYSEGHQSIVSNDAGTSFSSPALAGIVALWLQADPTLSVCDVREVLRATSNQDEYTEASPCRFGAGKVNALAGLKYILEKHSDAIDVLHSDLPASVAKYIQNGRFYIQRNGKRYDAAGRECK